MSIWNRLFTQYWLNFHWCTPLNVDPTEPILIDTSVDWVAPPTPKEVLTTEEQKKKTEVMQEVQKKIKTWFNHRCTSMGLTGNPWTLFLKDLRRPEGPAPKHLVGHQFYMQHPDFKEKVHQEYAAKYPDTPKAQQLNVKCKVAQTLWDAESEDVKSRLLAEAKESHAALLDAYNNSMEGLPSIDEEEREIARERFSSVATPLLVALAEYTGYKLTLLAGRVADDNDIQVLGLNTGKANDKTFPDWDPKVYTSTLQGFSRFVWASRDEATTPPAMNPVPVPTSTAPVREADPNSTGPVLSGAGPAPSTPPPSTAPPPSTVPPPSTASPPLTALSLEPFQHKVGDVNDEQ
ncbi:hypothetical protein K438DRAFT_1997700 [Mycena galopus ATCC 62051]|nr:hypothetical protein K438DRAFT_1997700 [Mycena galopus ATCC 62051]